MEEVIREYASLCNKEDDVIEFDSGYLIEFSVVGDVQPEIYFEDQGDEVLIEDRELVFDEDEEDYVLDPESMKKYRIDKKDFNVDKIQETLHFP